MIKTPAECFYLFTHHIMATKETKMQYVRFGNTGLRVCMIYIAHDIDMHAYRIIQQVSKIALGCMSYGSSQWQSWVKDEEESLAMIERAYKAGINFFDTADGYSNGESERVLGKAIKQCNMDRSRIVVATKVYFPVADQVGTNLLGGHNYAQDPVLANRYGLSRKHIFDAVEASLERLQLDYIDLYQVCNACCLSFQPQRVHVAYFFLLCIYSRFIGWIQ